ncbi:SprT-like domain-containing protein [Natranaeroarchaeum sulfidigenes]|uniref:Zn-dependent metalloprotease, SprT family n=1 Tax=Natranaeroarchaeum sulfidigenes TaxID=2784880 RepID=A0A897MS34_9EURY|nr:SprT-like domain-containing protein [Natranaeroarchaeum sulfidigenes]QSG03374.1 Zn-dependent metalloprotease, SprT family [Natranaeroarchaeum sulfidigenes]
MHSETDRADRSEAVFLDRARAYAQDIPIDVDLDAIQWTVSHRARRRAGSCRYDSDSGAVTVRLAWDAYREHGWDEMAAVIRHELVHAWEFQQFGESGHGARFRDKADEIDAPRHCSPFSEPRLRLVCTAEDCDWSADRFRASVTVTEPNTRRCGVCGARYRVEHVATGRSWRTNEGYEQARKQIGDEW